MQKGSIRVLGRDIDVVRVVVIVTLETIWMLLVSGVGQLFIHNDWARAVAIVALGFAGLAAFVLLARQYTVSDFSVPGFEPPNPIKVDDPFSEEERRLQEVFAQSGELATQELSLPKPEPAFSVQWLTLQ